MSGNLTKLAAGTAVAAASIVGLASAASATELHVITSAGCTGSLVKTMKVDFTNPWDVDLLVHIETSAGGFNHPVLAHGSWSYSRNVSTINAGSDHMNWTASHGIVGPDHVSMSWTAGECSLDMPTVPVTTPPETTVPATTVPEPTTTTTPEPTTVDVCGDFGDKAACQTEVLKKFGPPKTEAPTITVKAHAVQELPHTGNGTVTAVVGAVMFLIGTFFTLITRRRHSA